MSARAGGWLGLLLIASGCGGAAAGASPLWARPGFEGAVRPEMGPPQPGDSAPDFELPISGEGGGRLKLSSRRGRWVVLHFTTTWCPFCDEEIEHLDRLAIDYADRGVDALLVDVLEEPEPWRAYLHERLPEPKLLSLIDADGAVARRYAPQHASESLQERAHVVLAATLIVDPQGKIRLFLLADSKRFDPTLAAVRARLDELLGSSPKAEGPAPAPAPIADDSENLGPEQAAALAVVAPPALAPGASGELRVTLSIAPGHHVMANPASKPNYIATVVEVEAEGVTFGAPRYPTPTRFQLWDETIDTYQEQAVIVVPFELTADSAPGARAGVCKVRYQACTEASCLFPFTKSAPFELRVAGD